MDNYEKILGDSFERFMTEYDELVLSIDNLQNIYAHLDEDEIKIVVNFAKKMFMKFNPRTYEFEYECKSYQIFYKVKRELMEFNQVPNLNKVYNTYSKGYGIYIKLSRYLFYKEFKSDMDKIIKGEYIGLISEKQYLKIKEILK